MLNFVVRCLLVASWIVALVLSALTVEGRSSGTPLTSDAVVEVTEWHGEQRVTELRRDLTALAAAEGVVIGQVEPDVRDNRGSRIMYLTGPRAEGIIADPPRVDFGSSMRTSFAPMVEIEFQDPVGDWVVLGRQDAVPVLAEALREWGATVETRQNERWPRLEVPGNLEIAVGLMLASSAAALVLSRTRRAAISRLHGGSATGFAVKEFGPLGALWVGSGVLLLAVGGLWLLATQGGIGLLEWVAHSASTGIWFLGFAVVGAMATLGAVWRTDLVRALKGELPARGMIAASWAMRLGAIVLALAAIGHCLSLATAAASRQRSLEAMRSVPGAHLMFIGGALYSNEAQNAMGAVMGPWLQGQAESGRLLLAAPRESPVGQLLYVNRRYLASHPLQLSDGRDVRDVVGDDEVALLVPEDRWAERELIAADARESMEFEVGMGADVPTVVLMTPARQRLPLFGIPDETAGWSSHSAGLESTWVEEPIVLVVPNGGFNAYVSAAGEGRVLFFDAEALIQEIEADPVLAGYVTSLTPVEVRASRHAAEALIAFRMAALEAGIAGVIALMAGASLAVSYSRLRGPSILVRHLHGRHALGSYRLLLLAEVALVLGAVSWLPWQVMQRRVHFEALVAATEGGIGLGPPPELRVADLLPGALVVLVVSGGLVMMLFWVHRRIIRKGVSEA